MPREFLLFIYFMNYLKCIYFTNLKVFHLIKWCHSIKLLVSLDEVTPPNLLPMAVQIRALQLFSCSLINCFGLQLSQHASAQGNLLRHQIYELLHWKLSYRRPNYFLQLNQRHVTTWKIFCFANNFWLNKNQILYRICLKYKCCYSVRDSWKQKFIEQV